MSAYTRTAVIRSVELTSQNASAAVRADLSRGLTSLASITATASFVGFFGTVLGLMNSFPSIGGSRSTALAEVASRISDAMVSGILGLFVAVIAFWFHQYLRYQLQAFDLEMQNASVDLVNRHGVLKLIWPQLKSEFDATPALDTAAWVCFGCSILGWLAYWAQHRLVTGFLVLAFLIVAGAAIRRGLRAAVVVTLAYFLTVVCASIRSYGLTFSALCVAAVLFPLGGALRAVRWRAPIRPMRRSLRYGWSLLVISSGLAATNAALFGTVFGLFHTQAADDSMQPTVHAGDWLVGLSAQIAGPIQRNELWELNWGGLVGDVRVVGLPGDRVRIRKGVLVLNGNPLREPYCTPYREASGDFPLPAKAYSDVLLRAYHELAYLGRMENAIEYVVPPGYYFVLNDNRKQLSDSRTMGPIPRDQFVARLLVAYGSGVRVFTLGQAR